MDSSHAKYGPTSTCYKATKTFLKNFVSNFTDDVKKYSIKGIYASGPPNNNFALFRDVKTNNQQYFDFPYQITGCLNNNATTVKGLFGDLGLTMYENGKHAVVTDSLYNMLTASITGGWGCEIALDVYTKKGNSTPKLANALPNSISL